MIKLDKMEEIGVHINENVHFSTEIQSSLISLFLNYGLIAISYNLCEFTFSIVRYRPLNVGLAVMFSFMTIHLIVIVKNYLYFELLVYKKLLTREQLATIQQNKNNYWYIKYIVYAILIVISLFRFHIL